MERLAKDLKEYYGYLRELIDMFLAVRTMNFFDVPTIAHLSVLFLVNSRFHQVQVF